MRRFFSIAPLLALACSLYAKSPASVADSVPALDSVATKSFTTESTAAEDSTSSVPVESSKSDLTPDSSSASSGESVAAVTVDSSSTKTVPVKIDPKDIAKMFAPRKSKWPRFLPHGIYAQAGFASPSSVDINVGFMLPLSRSWNVSLGFDVVRTQLNFSDDFQTISDETLLTLGAGLVIGGIASVFNPGPSKSEKTDSAAVESSKKPMSTGMVVLGFVTLLPIYIYCGTLYLPIVPGDWLGVVDKSHLLTQLISEGFHKRSFTYIHDVGLRLSPIASEDGFLHGFVDGGIRFEKNFDSKLKYRYFAQAGFSRSF